MENQLRNYYFVIVKFVGLCALVFWGMTNSDRALEGASGLFMAGALFVLCSTIYELFGSKKRILWLVGEGILAVIAVFLFPVMGILLLAVVYLDAVCNFDVKWYWGSFVLLVLASDLKCNVSVSALLIIFMILLYYQHYKIVKWYQKTVGENQQIESKLKSDMEHSNIAHKDELKQSRLRHENDMLEEKARISQALHDKLGHSINGSLYKLEAVKVLIDKKPEECTPMLQDVIDNLRGSMDEIRVIIRNERPDKNKMALKSLYALCAECEEQYHIKASLDITPEEAKIPEKIWEIILDNTFEAVTNSLKYSGCDEIKIRIAVLGEVVRCAISDNGKGAEAIEEGMGISGMKQRVRSVKGYFDIDSQNGFMINMILPIGGKNGTY